MTAKEIRYNEQLIALLRKGAAAQGPGGIYERLLIKAVKHQKETNNG